ncbi:MULTISPECIES: acetoin utilization protein AcuC [Brevibacterium]|jgi:acetoin utilization protein AcuC|uniref:Acetoin utilization protein AcuC n=1 Tax=Brevibacterium salitolerans TaxID=1403566 RepID=A0ABN2WYU3_9MICO|nr:acetoin utilization protein AcuC [Brevibacterium sp.]
MDSRDLDLFVAWGDAFTEYDFGPSHPMHPIRLDLTAKLAGEYGLFDHPRITVSDIPDVDEDFLGRIHTQDFVSAVKQAGASDHLDEEFQREWGVGTEDVPRFEKIHEASGRIFQAGIEVGRAVASGRYTRAVNFCGGMHHAMSNRAAGFCVYNDVAATLTTLLDAGYQRIAYVDFDAHHGDGVETIFWDDPRVLTVSFHENGRFLFPGTGFANDIGGMQAAASAVNLALPPRTDDPDWLRAIDAVLPQVLRGFQPQILVTQHGCDGHRVDPLTHLRLSIDGMREAALLVRSLSEELCDGRWIATGGGGYSILDVVPRAWTQLIAIAAGADLDPHTELPSRWRKYAETMVGREAPLMMTDGFDGGFRSWAHGYDPEADLDRAVMATRKSIFPFFGLDAYYD